MQYQICRLVSVCQGVVFLYNRRTLLTTKCERIYQLVGAKTTYPLVKSGLYPLLNYLLTKHDWRGLPCQCDLFNIGCLLLVND